MKGYEDISMVEHNKQTLITPFESATARRSPSGLKRQLIKSFGNELKSGIKCQ